MPTLIAGPVQAVNDLADIVARQLEAGGPARASLGSKDVAFAWTVGAPATIATKVNRVVTEGLSFNAVLVGSSGTPAKKVAAGAQKPTAVTLTTVPVPVNKFAGLGIFSTEQALSTEALALGIHQTLIVQSLLAFDAELVDLIETNAGETATGTTWSAAILNGIAAVASNGGAPDLLVLNPADYAGAVEPPGYALDPTSGVPVLFGLEVTLSPAVTAGTGLVLASSAVTVAENVASPVVVLDPYSMLDTNQIRLASEVFAGAVVNAPSCVCKATKSGVTE